MNEKPQITVELFLAKSRKKSKPGSLRLDCLKTVHWPSKKINERYSPRSEDDKILSQVQV